VKVTAHQLRHTCATQLLNAGCRVTSIQKLMGHRELSTTMVYARVHDQTVADDYYRAMGSVERRLALVDGDEILPSMLVENEREQVLALAGQIMQPDVGEVNRMDLASQICVLLSGKRLSPQAIPETRFELALADHPPPR
jgi:hypothetical protein